MTYIDVNHFARLVAPKKEGGKGYLDNILSDDSERHKWAHTYNNMDAPHPWPKNYLKKVIEPEGEAKKYRNTIQTALRESGATDILTVRRTGKPKQGTITNVSLRRNWSGNGSLRPRATYEWELPITDVVGVGKETEGELFVKHPVGRQIRKIATPITKLYRPKLIASDLDGTIIGNYGRISDRTKAAFTAAHNLGIHIYFATGRPVRWLTELKTNFSFGNSICSNGAMIYDFINEKVLEQWWISVETQTEIVRRLTNVIPDLTFLIENDLKTETITQKPALKIIVRCLNNQLTSTEILTHANKTLSDIATVTYSTYPDFSLEISALGINKGSTLAKVAQKLGITADDVVTFGDGPNDLSMLQWAGRSWTLADGHPDALKYAKFVTEPHQDDGVAKIIEQLIELPA